MMQLDPLTGEAIGPVMHVPDSANSPGYAVLSLACAQQCRLVYVDGNTQPYSIVSWAPAEAAPMTVFSGKLDGSDQQVRTPVAAYTSDGRLWVAWGTDVPSGEWAKLGNSTGAGGGPIKLHQARGYDTPGNTVATTVGNQLVLATKWQVDATNQTAVWSTVVEL